MRSTERAKSMLPNMPEEVFDGFLKPLIIEDIGWPFVTIHDSLLGTDWFRILHPLTLADLSEYKWVRRVFLLNNSFLYPGSKEDIKLIITNKTEDV